MTAKSTAQSVSSAPKQDAPQQPEKQVRQGATADGYLVPLFADVRRPNQVPVATAHGAEGIGLLRTEFLFAGRKSPPSELEQAGAYGAMLAGIAGRVIVRVLNAGAAAPPPFLPSTAEPNPALGERGIRLLRRHSQVLTGQLSALARISRQDPTRLAVMAPMVTDAEEATWFRKTCEAAGLTCPVGVAIEVPAAALRARDLLEAVDFIALATDALTQYACAADAGHSALSRWRDPWQPGVLDLVGYAAADAAQVRKECLGYGEAADDPLLACVLVGLGVTSLAVSPDRLESVRAELARHTREQCVRAGRVARAARDAAAGRTAAHVTLSLPHSSPARKRDDKSTPETSENAG